MNERKVIKVRPTTLLVVAILVALTGFISYWLYQDHIGANGRLYPSKLRMCEDFAKSYLRTIRKTENIQGSSGGNSDWSRAIAIESEINNLCQLDLTDEALEGYSPSNIQKYLDDYRHN